MPRNDATRHFCQLQKWREREREREKGREKATSSSQPTVSSSVKKSHHVTVIIHSKVATDINIASGTIHSKVATDINIASGTIKASGWLVFHICADGRKISFLCPNGTIFRQSHLICDWWWTVDCAASREHYDTSAEQLANDQRIYRARADALAQSRARQQGGRKPGIIREYESTSSTTARPRQLSYNNINRPSSSGRSDQRLSSTPAVQSYTSSPPDSSNTQQEIQYEFSRNYYTSQNYQTARPQQTSPQNQLSPFRSAGGTHEEFQQGRGSSFQSEQASVSGSRQSKQFEEDRPTSGVSAHSSGFPQSQAGQQVTNRPFPQTTIRPEFVSPTIPPQQSFSRPQQQSVNRSTQQELFSQQSGRKFNNKQRTLTSTAKSSFSLQNSQQSLNRNNQQQSVYNQADKALQSSRNLELKNSQTPRPVTIFSSHNNQGRASGQPAKSLNVQIPINSTKFPQSQKQSRDGKGRSYNHYTLFYDSEGERQQLAETGSFVGNRGNQFASSNKQQFLPQFKDADNLNTEEKIKFLVDVSPVNFQNKSSSHDFDFQRNEASTSSKPVLDVALSRKVPPITVEVLKTNGSSKFVHDLQVLQRELQPPEEHNIYNKNSGKVNISEERQERKIISENNKQILNNSHLNSGEKISNQETGNNFSYSEVEEFDDKDAGFPGIAVEVMTEHDLNLTEVDTKKYSEETLDHKPPTADEIVENINQRYISTNSKLLEQPSLFDFTNSSGTTDMPVTTTAKIDDSQFATGNDSQDSSFVIEDEGLGVSEYKNVPHFRNNNQTVTLQEITSVSDKPTSVNGRSSRRRKPTSSANTKLIENIVFTTQPTIVLVQSGNMDKTETQVLNTASKSKLNESRNQTNFQNNSRTMRTRTRTSSKAVTSTEQSVFSSRSSRYRIPSLRIIEVTIRSSSTPSPYRVTVPVIRSREEYSARGGVDSINSNIYSTNIGDLTQNINNDEDIISLVSLASPSSRSGRFRTPTTVTPKILAMASTSSGVAGTENSGERLNNSVLTKSDSNTNIGTADSRRKARLQTQPPSVLISDSGTIIPPLLPLGNISNESSTESYEDTNSSEEMPLSPVLESEEVTDKPLALEEMFDTQSPTNNTPIEYFETTILPSTVLYKRKMGRQRIMKPDISDVFELTDTEENSSSGLAVALSQKVRSNRVQVKSSKGKNMSENREERPEFNITIEGRATKDSNDTVHIQGTDSGDNIILEKFTSDPQVSVVSSDNETENYSLESLSHLTSGENLNSSGHETFSYSKFGVAEYDAENVSRKLYVHLNRTISPDSDSHINATGRLLFIEKNLPQHINSQENIEYKVQNETKAKLVSSAPVRSSNGEMLAGRKSVKYTDVQRQREKISVPDSHRRYKPTTTTERTVRTTRKSLTTDDSFTQVTRSLYTKLTRELLPPKEEPARDAKPLTGDLLDVSKSIKDPVTLNDSMVNRSQTESMEQFESSREGLAVPQALGPKALHSLSVYFATNSENTQTDGTTISNYDNILDKEANPSKESAGIDNESFVSTTLPPLITQLTKNSYARLSATSKKTSPMQLSTSVSMNAISSSATEKMPVRSRGKSRNQDRGERARKIDTAIRELQEDYKFKLSKSENIHMQDESSTNFTSSDFHESDLVGNKTPDLRALAQVFSRALSAYLDDPEEFRKALSEVRPTESSSITPEEETHSTTYPNTVELSSALASADFPSATKEKDEVLEYSDVTKLPMLKRPLPKNMKGSRHHGADILNTESSSYLTSNGLRKTEGSIILDTTNSNINFNKSIGGNSESEEIRIPKKLQKDVPKVQATEPESKFSEWLHSTPDPSTIAQEINSLFTVNDEDYTTPPDTEDDTVTIYWTNQNQTYFAPTAGGVNDGSRPRYGGFQNNLEIKAVSNNNRKASRGSRRKSATAVPIEELTEPTTFSPLNKYIINTESLPIVLTPPKNEDIPWSEEVKKEEVFDDVLGAFIPEDLNNLAESGGTAPSTFDDEKSGRGSRKNNISVSVNSSGHTSQNSRRRLAGNRERVTSDIRESHLDGVSQNMSAIIDKKVLSGSEIDELLYKSNTESLNSSKTIESKSFPGSREIESQVQNSQQTSVNSKTPRVISPTLKNIVYSRNSSLKEASSNEENKFDDDSTLSSHELPISAKKSSVIYSDLIEATPDYSLLRSGKSKYQNTNRNGRQRSRVYDTSTSELSNFSRTTSAVNTTSNKNDTNLNSRVMAMHDEGNMSSSTPIPTSGYTSYSNVEITSKSMVRVTPNGNKRQSRKFKSTTITTLMKDNRQNILNYSTNTTKNLTRDSERSEIKGEISENNYGSEAVSVVTPITVTETSNLAVTWSTSSSSQSTNQRESSEKMASMSGDSGRMGRRFQTSAGTNSEVRDMMAKFTEAMDTPEQAEAMEHLRRMLSDSKKNMTGQEVMDMPELNVTSATALLNVMKTATTNSTVRRLVLLLVNDSLRDNTIQEAQLRFLDAILRLPEGQQSSRRQPQARRRPPTTQPAMSSRGMSRRGRKYSPTTTTEETPTTESSTEDVVEQTTALSSHAPPDDESSPDENYEIDERATPVFTCETRWVIKAAPVAIESSEAVFLRHQRVVQTCSECYAKAIEKLEIFFSSILKPSSRTIVLKVMASPKGNIPTKS
ncbi:hypothetical protein PR048_009168 [Dryococelus australis]|uniref:Chitin-binding type-2 domain-containing protein n=1 Tax=Dryococelus australis TaxID=614101 RepID=A0ABQ9HZ44_9NEOP|nr:hypothetical protein PR048_009168 [Dryococelus australis]